jgi:hypothetical protein
MPRGPKGEKRPANMMSAAAQSRQKSLNRFGAKAA